MHIYFTWASLFCAVIALLFGFGESFYAEIGRKLPDDHQTNEAARTFSHWFTRFVFIFTIIFIVSRLLKAVNV